VAVASCQSAPTDRTAAAPVAASATTPPAAPPVAAKVAAFTGFRRYRGTVGGQPVTVELTIGPKSEKSALLVCEGFYSYDRHPGGQLLLKAPQPYPPQQPLLLAEAESEQPRQATGRWQATQPAGPTLAGTWTSPTGKQLPFSLHEDYTDGQGHLMAVRYELLDEHAQGAPCKPEAYEGEDAADYRQRMRGLPAASLDRQYLHLLGPEATRPALRALQCPTPRARRAEMRAALAEVGDCANSTDNLTVTYNAYGLLAVSEYHEEYYQGTPHPNHTLDATIYDLRTGQALALSDLLKPDTDHTLRQLITSALRTDMELSATEVLHPAEGDTATTELPHTGVGLAAEGMVFEYTDSELGAYAYGMPAVTIAWVELMPLLRPSTPVAQMLRARGLWRAAKK
jgi:hypothetical protein